MTADAIKVEKEEPKKGSNDGECEACDESIHERHDTEISCGTRDMRKAAWLRAMLTPVFCSR